MHRPVNAIACTTALCLGLAACAAVEDSQHAAALSHLADEIATLEQRKQLLEDVNDIKRLQRSYGYYFDEGLWDEAALLFTKDGSIEIGLDGVYRGRQRVRDYLYALGGGKAGLSPGQLNEHLQLMPVITVAADGRAAQGTWRAVALTGQLGKDAYWGEGSYESQYIKEDGVWKISQLHWFQTLRVPYEGGWAKNADVTGGKYVSDRLPPDAPPSVSYKVWPGTFVPQYHFKGLDPAARNVAAPVKVSHAAQSAGSLRKRAARLARDVEQLHHQHEIENLQRIYGFYLDKGMWDEAADLFSENGELEIAGRGVYAGKARVKAYLHAIGPAGPKPGRLFDNMQLQPIVHVAPNGQTAKGRWHLFAQLAESNEFHEWGVGVYENDYVNENGVWKIRRLHLYPTMFSPYEDGWGKTALSYSRFEPSLAPDRPPTVASQDYRGNSFVPPFHYANPARRQASRATAENAGAIEPDLQKAVEEIERRIGLAEDVMRIEDVQTIYGYYLATLQWDALTDLFADDGTIEIAMRGVYVGKEAVRRNLNLYGEQGGLHEGVLHNHMQYQPVIHVAEDGQTAKLRSRAFSMMGSFGRAGTWMGGVYENDLIKVNGVWKLKKDQVMNTYFAPYDVGWKTLAQRPPPGITNSNPPDRPPSFPFEMFPKNFLPPYHYANPVTGRSTPPVAPNAAAPASGAGR